MSKASGNNPQSSDSIIIFLLFIMIGIGCWHLFKKDIVRFMVTLTKPQLEFYQNIPLIIPEAEKVKMAAILKQLESQPASSFSSSAIPVLLNTTGYGLRVFVIPLLLGALFWAYLRDYKSRFVRHFNLNSLAVEAAKVNPFILPIVGKNLHKQSFMEGPFRRPLSGIELAGALGLLKYKEEPMAKSNPKIVNASITEKRNKWIDREKAKYVSLDKKKADKYYQQQLGKPFICWDSLPPHYQAMLAITISRIAGGNGIKTSSELLESIAASYSDETKRNNKLSISIDYKNSKEIISKYWNNAIVQNIVRGHGWEKTLLMGTLEESRRKGKLPPNQFLWLKLVDRDLFLTLNPVGTPHGGTDGAFFESQGAWAQFQVEKKLKKAIHFPAIEGATDALEENLRKEEWIDVKNQESLRSTDASVVAKYGIDFQPNLNSFSYMAEEKDDSTSSKN